MIITDVSMYYLVDRMFCVYRRTYHFSTNLCTKVIMWVTNMIITDVLMYNDMDRIRSLMRIMNLYVYE